MEVVLGAILRMNEENKNKKTKKTKNNKKKKNKFNFKHYDTMYKKVIDLFKHKYNPTIDNKAIRDIDEPCLIFGNHGSVFDFIFAGSAIYPKKAVFVVTRRTMYDRISKKIVKMSPHILRDQFSSDLRSIIDMGDALKQGYNVVLYPEGKVSTCGKTNIIPKATGKLVKTFKVPVVTIVCDGNWLAKPSWASHVRVGNFNIRTKQILTREQIKQMTAEEIQLLLEQELCHNENKYQLEGNYEYHNILKSKGFAEGLEKVLYKCPKCGKDFTMHTKGSDIFCEECGFRATYNHNGLITSEDKDFKYYRIDKWVDYENEELKKELLDDNFIIKSVVEAQVENKIAAKYDKIGKGTLIMDKQKITFSSFDNKTNLQYNIDKVEGIPFVVGVRICLLIDDVNYEFVFKDKLMSTKYNMAVELLAEDRNVRKKEGKDRN